MIASSWSSAPSASSTRADMLAGTARVSRCWSNSSVSTRGAGVRRGAIGLLTDVGSGTRTGLHPPLPGRTRAPLPPRFLGRRRALLGLAVQPQGLLGGFPARLLGSPLLGQLAAHRHQP